LFNEPKVAYCNELLLFLVANLFRHYLFHCNLHTILVSGRERPLPAGAPPKWAGGARAPIPKRVKGAHFIVIAPGRREPYYSCATNDRTVGLYPIYDREQFYPHYASRGPVLVCVCPSVTSRSSIETAEEIGLVSA